MKIQNIDQELLSSVLHAISEDKFYDKKSILWDGSTMQVITDELDSKDILDGRFGPFMTIRIETLLGINLYSFCTIHNNDLFSSSAVPDANNSEEYRIETENRFLFIKKHKKDECESLQKAFSDDVRLIELENHGASAPNIFHRKFSGLVETSSGKIMIGYVLLTAELGNNSYSLVYAGIGNYTDIQVEANQILRSFLDHKHLS